MCCSRQTKASGVRDSPIREQIFPAVKECVPVKDKELSNMRNIQGHMPDRSLNKLICGYLMS